MKPRALAVVPALFLAACGGAATGSPTTPDPAAPPTPAAAVAAAGSGPIAARPLAGSLDGSPAAPKTVVVDGFSGGGAATIRVYDEVVPSCDAAWNPRPGARGAIATVTGIPWRAGTYELSRDAELNAGFEFWDGGTSIECCGDHDWIGRVEIVEAPTSGQATLRLRLDSGSPGTLLEGEARALVCGDDGG